MGPQHYAISEAAVLVSALVCLVALTKAGKPLAAVAAGLLGLAGAIGVVRFGAQRVEALKVVHQLVSQMGGLTAMGLMAQYLLGRKKIENWWLWLWVNLLTMGLMAYQSLWLTTVLYGLFSGLSLVGLRAWRQQHVK